MSRTMDRLAFAPTPTRRPRQGGASLVELMVGLVIGLLTVLTALGAMAVSRQLTGTASDASQVPQQAAHALRVLGGQLRQAGPWALDPGTLASDAARLLPPAADLGPTLRGMDQPAAGEFHLQLRTASLQEASHLATGALPKPLHLLRDCLGESSSTQERMNLVSRFRWEQGQLYCQGQGTLQPLVSGVRDFQALYLQQRLDRSRQPPVPRFRYAPAQDLAEADWSEVLAVEICLELEGVEAVDNAGASYTRCNGDRSARPQRLQMVFRGTYHLRNPMHGG